MEPDSNFMGAGGFKFATGGWLHSKIQCRSRDSLEYNKPVSLLALFVCWWKSAVVNALPCL